MRKAKILRLGSWIGVSSKNGIQLQATESDYSGLHEQGIYIVSPE